MVESQAVIEVPIRVYEAVVLGGAAFLITAVVGALCYWLGVRDRDRKSFLRGYTRGLNHKNHPTPFDGEYV